jgi:hypothetical protein
MAAMTAVGTSRTSGDVRLESAEWAEADIDQIAVTTRDLMGTRPATRRLASACWAAMPCDWEAIRERSTAGGHRYGKKGTPAADLGPANILSRQVGG